LTVRVSGSGKVSEVIQKPLPCVPASGGTITNSFAAGSLSMPFWMPFSQRSKKRT
jgi:hypothetical protein